MKVPARLFACTSIAIMLTAVTTIVIPLAVDPPTIANAQQLQQPPSNQTPGIENETLFQNTMDKFRVQVPAGWVIQDVDNTGSALEAEVTQGYGILAQLCAEEDEQQTGGALSNLSHSSGSTAASCQGSEGDIIHIDRYPNVETAAQQTDDEDEGGDDNNGSNNNFNLTAYYLEKLQEVGYTNIQTINDTMTTVKLILPQTSQTIAELPAKLIEMTYSTASTPNEIRTGYYLLTAPTPATSPNPGILTGYGVFYEGKPMAVVAETTTSPASLAPTPLPIAVRHVFDSFEL
ncbi:MAG: hypothetical protein M3270_03825, partial [Thermoproteota archaeon]|nr:hypothetical protein [Thermoproteota archaeon]